MVADCWRIVAFELGTEFCFRNSLGLYLSNWPPTFVFVLTYFCHVTVYNFKILKFVSDFFDQPFIAAF